MQDIQNMIKQNNTIVINDNKENDLILQNKAGVQSNLVFFRIGINEGIKIKPKRHSTSPFDKMRRMKNLPNPVQPNKQPSPSFLNKGRQELFQNQKLGFNNQNITYNPQTNLIKPNSIIYSISPLQSQKPRQRVHSPPECIYRGNTCSSEIRGIIKLMKQIVQDIQDLENA
ncbi:hypothetical protein PPERSA_07485 [Pseudocohnilembus persalinus]|uniref:Uncharacterized protein n=1 Tax=Pseudocohnilembus persalinus TaxID=266149 RepID=A0A0V0R2F7_PSEPJ|nr:hypothetical protein PPERSA_07485 [Pseudocohnilembus persalinus]|eukprot:KRX08673.1 hypothetical protein PPERSA_07485 [Pseudocohnilembus persalinus]